MLGQGAAESEWLAFRCTKQLDRDRKFKFANLESLMFWLAECLLLLRTAHAAGFRLCRFVRWSAISTQVAPISSQFRLLELFTCDSRALCPVLLCRHKRDRGDS